MAGKEYSPPASQGISLASFKNLGGGQQRGRCGSLPLIFLSREFSIVIQNYSQNFFGRP